MKTVEKLFIAEKINDEYIIKGFAEREYIEKYGIRHLTTIIIPYITDGNDKRKWILHDRSAKIRAKMWVKGKCPPFKTEYDKSYNLIGGHCSAEGNEGLFGEPIQENLIREDAKRELTEEVYTEGDDIFLEIWDENGNTGKTKSAKKYNCDDLLEFVGVAEYGTVGSGNVEYSFVYALPISSVEYNNLLFADDYISPNDKKNHNVFLEKKLFTADELANMPIACVNGKSSAEICDAITRLWLPQNKAVLKKLLKITNK